MTQPHSNLYLVPPVEQFEEALREMPPRQQRLSYELRILLWCAGIALSLVLLEAVIVIAIVEGWVTR